MTKPMSCLLVLMALSGCGGEGLSGGDPSAFVGTWAHSGMLTANCGILGSFPQELTGNMVCTASGDELQCASESPACTWAFTVNGDTATMKPGQTCNVTASGATIVLSPKSWTMKLDGTGTTATETGTGNANATVPTFGEIPCTFTANGTITKA